MSTTSFPFAISPGLLIPTDMRIQDRPTHPTALALFEYWQLKRHAEPMPLRADIDPVDIPALLPYIGLLEVEVTDKVRFKVRVQGTSSVDLVDEERTGQYIDDVASNQPEDQRLEIVRRQNKVFLQVHETATPLFTHSIRQGALNQCHAIHTGVMPLTTDGRTVSHLLGCMIHEQVDNRSQQ